MNEFLKSNIETVLIAIFIAVLLFLFILIISVVYLILKMNKNSQSETQKIIDLPEAEETTHKTLFCPNHQEKEGVGICGICELPFCDKCLMEYENLRFCPEHFNTYTNHEWESITDVRTTPQEPENGVFIYEFKTKIWVENETPTFIVTDYRIDINNDLIESYVRLFVRKEDRILLEKKIK